jgi:two-component sensor histidine kinase
MDARSREQSPFALGCLAETGGPPVGKRKADGFGTTLIDSVFANAKVERDFRRDGFVFAIELVLPETAEDGTSGET